MALVRSRSTDFPQVKSVSASTRQLQEALYTHLDDLEKSAFIDALSAYGAHRDIFELVNALRKILNTPVKRKLFPLVRKIIRPGDVKAFDLLTKADKQSGTLPRPHLYRPHIADINVLNKHRASSLPDISRGGNKEAPPIERNRAALPSRYRPSPGADWRGAWSGGEEGEEPNSDRQLKWGAAGDKHKTHSTRSKNSSDEIVGDVFEIDIGEPSLAGEGFGFTIRGGLEHEMGVYVSSVDHGSTAHKNGLTVGDLLLEVNNISFRGIPHQEAVKIIKAATRLQLVVSRVGRIPGSHTVLESFRWTDPKGRPVSPPPEGSGGAAGEDDGRGRSGTRMLQGSDERKINIMVQKGQGLGLMIRGGNEYGLGIFVSGIDPYSVAENAGIKLGDQIIDVNGRSYLDISHSQAVSHLKKGRHLIMTVRDIGKIPFAKTVIDEKGWIESTRVNSYSKSGSTRSLSGSITDQESEWKTLLRQKKNPWLQSNERGRTTKGQKNLTGDGPQVDQREIIHEQANHLLNSSEQATLNYYLGEYEKETIGINGLTQAMLELLNTPAKLTLLAGLRSAVREKDLELYDKTILTRERRASLASARKMLAPDTLSMLSFDSADIPTTDKHKRTMFSKPATLSKPPTSMEVLDFSTDNHTNGGDQVSHFTLSSSKGRRLSRSTPDLSKVDRDYNSVIEGSGRHQASLHTRSRSRSKSPRTLFRTLGRGKSEEPSDDSGVEINGHAPQTPGLPHQPQANPLRPLDHQNIEGVEQESARHMVSNSRSRHHRHQQKQFITHVAEVHRREGGGGDFDQDYPSQRNSRPNNTGSDGNNDNIASYHHRRERQRLARRQEDSTTTDEDIVTHTTFHRSQIHTSGDPQNRHRSASRERGGGRIKPRSRSSSSSRQPASSNRSRGQGQVFLTVPAQHPAQNPPERGRTARRPGISREDSSNFGQRSSSSSASPQNKFYNPIHHHQQQQQQQTRGRRDKTNWWTTRRRNDSYNTDTSTTESTIGRRDQLDSSTRTESTLTVNGKLIPSSLSPQHMNSFVIEDALVSSPAKWYQSKGKHDHDRQSSSKHHHHEQTQSVYFEERPSRARSKSPRGANSARISRSRSPQNQRKPRPTAESLFYQAQSADQASVVPSGNTVDRIDHGSYKTNAQHQKTSLLPLKRTPLYLSPKRAAPEKNDVNPSERSGQQSSIEEGKDFSSDGHEENSILKTRLDIRSGTGSTRKTNIPLIKINSQAMPKAASEASKTSAHNKHPEASLTGTEVPLYTEPVKQRDRVTISDTPTHIDSTADNGEGSDTGSLASTITSHKHVTSISVKAPAARTLTRQTSGTMDGCLGRTLFRLPRPAVYTPVELAIMDDKKKLEATKARAREKYGEIFLDIVYIYRSQPTLGVAIEGGANTRQPLPKVINVQPGGSAFESGGLKVGHVILEVNGQPIVGLSHNSAARVIAEAFKSRTSDRMELLITEWSDRLLDTIQVDVGLLKVS